MTTLSYAFEGVTRTWVVPNGVTELVNVTLIGGGGGKRGGAGATAAGDAGIVTVAVLPVNPGETLTFAVGGAGADASTTHHGEGGFGLGTGGDGGVASSGGNGGGGGGGSTGIYRRVGFIHFAAVAVAGGGGGNCTGHKGGNGTGTNGAGTDFGHGGTNSTPGAGGGNGTDGVGDLSGRGTGGTGGTFSGSGQDGGGGGGAGYQPGGGGGSGASSAGSGGGGASYVDPGATTVVIAAATGTGSTNGSLQFSYNAPPNAPIINTPVNNSSVNKETATTFDWDFSDPDPADTQTRADFRWRIGTGAWTEIDSIVTTATTWDSAVGAWATYVDQVIGYQIRTYDNASLVGAWSAERFFTPRTTPSTPSFHPVPVIDSNDISVDFTAPVVMAGFQIRLMSDLAGSPDAVLADTGPQVTAPATELLIAPFTYAYVNGTAYHVQVRYYRYAYAFSAWLDSGPIVADINAPSQPTLTISPDDDTASVTIEITNPGSDPFPPDHNDIYRTDLDNMSDEVRIATDVAINGTYTDFLPGFNTLYRYRVVAVTALGAFTSSA